MRILISFVIFVVMSACSGVNHYNNGVDLKYGKYQLQAVPKVLQGTGHVAQILVESERGTEQLLAQIELIEQQIKMVGLSTEGVTLFELIWSQGNLSVNSNILAKDIPAVEILTYFQLSTWPNSAIEKGLSGLKLHQNKQQHTLEFTAENELIFNIVKFENQSILTHFKDNYSVKITVLEAWNNHD